ncbi:MAG TPA: YciI family protein [Ktedonobacteraceae bacterium]|jgi:hypothetical protein|nr:YciI family protein [Ktedonobacteraceae bacterium]
MQYVALIYENETAFAQRNQEAQAAEYADYNAFSEEARRRGVMSQSDYGQALMPTHTATTVRVRDGKVLSTDGPFAETKEQLGGFYLLNCKDLDEAIEFAAKIPAVKNGSIEVRPIMTFE